MRLEIYVRPNASTTDAGGEFDGVLAVRVSAPALDGKATDAALATVADALGLRRRTITLVRGATSRRKLLEIDVSATDEAVVSDRLQQLRTRPRA